MTLPPILFLTHRIPFPPDKGDKLRSYHLLRHLAAHYRVFLGTFVDDPKDEAHVERLREWCEDVCAVRINPLTARIASTRALLSGDAMSVSYYRSGALMRWVQSTLADHGIARAVAFCSPMAQYLDHPGLQRRIVDFCDLDSAKWQDYAATHRWPMSWIYRREARTLLAHETAVASAADHSLFTSEREVRLLIQAQPALSSRVSALANGVDAGYFSPQNAGTNPYPAGGPVVVFTGAMDYWPNVDAVTWFVDEVLPALQEDVAGLRFYIVGMNPAPQVRALASRAGVYVTGRVDDVRPWVAHADVAVAPLRIARGIQNKVLEAMAMQKPVVMSPAAAAGLDTGNDRICELAESADDFRDRIVAVLRDRERALQLARHAREHVLEHYSWDAHLGRLQWLLSGENASCAA